MKKYINIFSFLALVTLLSFAGVVSGEEETSGERKNPNEERKVFIAQVKTEREEFRAEMETKRAAFMAKQKTDREAFLAELKTKREEWRAKASEAKEEWRGRALTMIGNRFEVAVRNLERIQARVGEVINTLPAGEDKDAAADWLEASEDKLEEAQVKITEIKNALPDSGEKITVEVFEKIKLLAREAKDLLKESHHNLVEAIKAVKDAKGESDDSDENEDDEDEEGDDN